MNLKDTQAAMRAFEASGKDDQLYFDDTLTGFALRIRRSGDRVLKRWLVQYRHLGRSRRFRIGDAEKLSAGQAREAARKLLARAELGEDPQGDRTKDRAQGTLAEVVDLFIEARSAEWRARTAHNRTRYLKGSAFKPLHAMPVNKIERADVAACLLKISKASGAATARSAWGALSACFTWALGQGLAPHNPMIGATKPPPGKPREIALGVDELVAVWKATGRVADRQYAAIVRLLIALGQRRGEVGGMRWSELDLDGGRWVIPPERAKNGRRHELPLPPLALAIIRAVPVVDGRDNLFGSRAAGGFTAWPGGKLALDAALPTGAIRKEHAGFTLHDLRRSFASALGDAGTQPHVIEVILNHASGFRAGVGGTYNKSAYQREVRAALALWNDHIRALVEGTGTKIVALRTVS
jgi:integrase